MIRGLAVVAIVAGCGRLHFSDETASDAAPDGGIAHVHTAPGWTASVLVDLTGVVPYDPNDFLDGGTTELDNAPSAVAALYPPFSSVLAVCAGREIIELSATLAPTVHDFTPATPDTTGPDACSHLVFGTTSDVGSALWIGAGTQGGGDGVYYATAAWALTRDSTNNNVNGIGFDPVGTFDNFGAAAIYFAEQTYVYRRTGPNAGDQIYLEPTNDSMGGQIVVTSAELYVVNQPNATADLDSVSSVAHGLSVLASADSLGPADARDASNGVAALRSSTTLALYRDNGTATDIASSLDPQWVWIAATAPAAPHPYANAYVVLESNRTLDRDELVLITPF